MAKVIDAQLLDRRMLRAVAPFHFEGTVHKPSHFPSQDNAYEDRRYWQTVNFRGRKLGLRFATTGQPYGDIEVRVYGRPDGSVDMDTLEHELRWRFDLDVDLREFNRLFASDPVLGSVIDRWRGMRVSWAYSLYEFLLVSVVLQNATVRRSVQMLDALFRQYGTLVRFDGKELYAFWAPEELSAVTEEALRALKVGYRARTIQRLTAHFASNAIDEHALRGRDKQSLAHELLELYGIGPASVGMLLFEVFHHYDAFDAISPWEQKIYSKLLFSMW